MEDSVSSVEFGTADIRDGLVYRLTDELLIGTKVALITGRPLLIKGPAGCGKSSYAAFLARNLQFELHQYTVTEASDPAHLLWEIDHVRRLKDAQTDDLDEDFEHYFDHGVLWQAFEPRPSDEAVREGAVVLLDEIDKADASFANSLLVPIGSREFDVPLPRQRVCIGEGRMVLVIITSNGERDLPPAFIRRCVAVSVSYPTAQDLTDIVSRRWPAWVAEETFRESVGQLAKSITKEGRAGAVSTAEFLDLVQVLRQGDITPDSPTWSVVEQVVLAREHDAHDNR
ncbi:MAG: AAA domain-containing protein [bacterium]|nr:AAA domain-containing protein [bacterium]